MVVSLQTRSIHYLDIYTMICMSFFYWGIENKIKIPCNFSLFSNHFLCNHKILQCLTCVHSATCNEAVSSTTVRQNVGVFVFALPFIHKLKREVYERPWFTLKLFYIGPTRTKNVYLYSMPYIHAFKSRGKLFQWISYLIHDILDYITSCFEQEFEN